MADLDPEVAASVTRMLNDDGTVTLVAEDVPFTVSPHQSPFGDIRPDVLLWRKNVSRVAQNDDGTNRVDCRNMQMWGADFHRLVKQIGFANVLDYVAHLDAVLDAWVLTGVKHEDEPNFIPQHPLPR